MNGIVVNYRVNNLIYQMILVKLSNNKWHNLSNNSKNQIYMAQNRTNGGFVSNMYEILNAYMYVVVQKLPLVQFF